MKNNTDLKITYYFLYFVIILVGVSFRFYNYDFQDFWWDELMEFTTSNPNLTLMETYQNAHSITKGSNLEYDYASNANFYFYIYKFIFYIFSYTPSIARLISVFFGSLVIILSITLYYKFISKNIFLLSILVSTNYYLIIQSQEFKYNIFFCFISLLSIIFFFLISGDKKFVNKKITKFLYFIFTFLTIWTHIFGFIILFSQGLCLLLKKRNILFENFLYYLTLPILYFIINFKQIVNFTRIKKFHVPQIQTEFFSDFYFKYFFGSLISGKIFFLVFLILFFYNFKKLVNNRIEILFFVIVIFFSYFLPLVYSLISKPILETRYVIYIVPCLIILMAYMISLIKQKLLRGFITFILISVSVLNTTYSVLILKKNDKPHISEVISNINNYDSDTQIYVVTSNSYLLTYLKQKKSYQDIEIYFISCQELNKIDLDKWWEIKIFPETRFRFCNEISNNSNNATINTNIIETIEAKYAVGYLIKKD